MGPRPDGRGRLVGGDAIQDEVYTAFNGAAAGWPRKDVNELGAAPALVLQWGRGRMAAEGPCQFFPPPAGRYLQWGRGRMAAEGSALLVWSWVLMSFNGAAAGWPRKEVAAGLPQQGVMPSMGPRPDGRGRGFQAGLQAAGQDPSMGPRPDGGGRVPRRQRLSEDGHLQWGRGRMAAEGRTCTHLRSAGWTLQWGRGRMAAEGRAGRGPP